MPLPDRRYADATFAAFEGLDRAGTGRALADALAPAVGAFGFDSFVLASSRVEPSNFDKMILLDHWPMPWRMQYQRENLFPSDPVAKRARQTLAPFGWDEVAARSAAEKRVMAIPAADYGLKQGFVVPVHGVTGYQATISLAGEEADLSAGARRAVELIVLYAYRRTMRLRSTDKKFVLTPREREVMTWAAAGKSAWDTGEILRISEETVKTHISSVRAKLDVCSKAQAIVESIRRGEIEL